MEHHRPFVNQLRSCLATTPSLASIFAKRLGVTVEIIRSWVVHPPDLCTALFWRIAWLINEQGYLCRELAERDHLRDLFFVITHEESGVSHVLMTLRVNEATLFRAVSRKCKLSKAQREALKPFLIDIQFQHEAESKATQLVELLKEASDLAVSLNGSAGAVRKILQKDHSVLVAPLAAILV